MTQVPVDAADLGGAVGAVLRRKREGRGLTRAQIEEAAGLSRSTLRRIETGLKPATVNELASIIGAINAKDDAELPDLTVLDIISTAVSRSTTPE